MGWQSGQQWKNAVNLGKKVRIKWAFLELHKRYYRPSSTENHVKLKTRESRPGLTSRKSAMAGGLLTPVYSLGAPLFRYRTTGSAATATESWPSLPPARISLAPPPR